MCSPFIGEAKKPCASVSVKHEEEQQVRPQRPVPIYTKRLSEGGHTSSWQKDFLRHMAQQSLFV